MHNYKYKSFKYLRNLIKFIEPDNIHPLSIYEENGFIVLIYEEV